MLERQARLAMLMSSYQQLVVTSTRLNADIQKRREELNAINAEIALKALVIAAMDQELERQHQEEEKTPRETEILDTTFYDNESKCMVCLEEWNDNKRFAIPCGHVVCNRCLTPTCAKCKTAVTAYITLNIKTQ